jgi:hypothetical protein
MPISVFAEKFGRGAVTERKENVVIGHACQGRFNEEFVERDTEDIRLVSAIIFLSQKLWVNK